MSHRYATTNVFSAAIRPSLTVVLAAIGLLLTASVGCDGQEVVTENEEQNQEEQNQNQEEENQDPGDDHPDEYFEAHGPDEDEELIDAGSLQGSWRTAFVEGNVPLAYLDIFHDEGESSATGDFMMGIAISDMQDGTTGSLESVTIDGDNVEIEWNPTDAQEEMYLLSLDREDDDTYSGTFSAEMYPETHEASMTRRDTD